MNECINLAGEWKMRYELDDEIHSVVLPGALQAQGFGEDVKKNTPFVQSLADPLWYEREEFRYGQEEKVRIPYMAQPPKTYYGTAVYEKTVELEKGHYQLILEKVKWQSALWVDGKYVGTQDLLCTSHVYEFDTEYSGDHVVKLEIDNNFKHPYRPDGHEVSDGLAATWNGVGGSIVLRHLYGAWISNNRVFTDVENSTVSFWLDISTIDENSVISDIVSCIKVRGTDINEYTEYTNESENFRQKKIDVKLNSVAKLWDEYEQNIYEAEIELYGVDGRLIDINRVSYGFRKICIKDGCFNVNGRPTYLRGTHFGGEYPLTGVIDTSHEYWDKIMRTVREWGLNFIRCHSYCPPEAAFRAADEAGVYLQIECGMWNSFSEGIPMIKILDEETKQILDKFGNHPSFLLFSPSNEPEGKWEDGLKYWPKKWKEYDNRHFYTEQSGWPYSIHPENIDVEGMDYLYFHRSGFGVEPGGTIRNSKGYYGNDYRLSLGDCKYPVICHELGQWCSYPDYSVIDKFTGYMQPENYRLFRDSAKAHGVLEQNKDFTYNSGRLQLQMYKNEIEANMRTPHIYGFELLDLHDYLAQGTSVVGVLDPFWDNKGFTTPEEWKHFCSETVLLARIPWTVIKEGSKAEITVESCHFGADGIIGGKLTYYLTDGENKWCIHNFEDIDIPVGKLNRLPDFKDTIPAFEDGISRNISFVAEYKTKDRVISNSWEFFVDAMKKNVEYEIDTPSYSVTLNPVTALRKLKEGKNVLLFAKECVLNRSNVPLRYYPIFWNAQMGPKTARIVGMLVDGRHDIFNSFKTKTYATDQWKTIMDNAYGIDVESFGDRIKNIVQPIDDWNRNKKLSLIFETVLAQGRLVLAAFDPKAGRTNELLAASLGNYMEKLSNENNTQEAGITEAEFESIFFDRFLTMHSQMEVKYSMLPAVYEIKLPKMTHIAGIKYFPDQKSRAHEEEWENIFISVDEESGKKVSLLSSFAEKDIYFDKPVMTDKLMVCVEKIYENLSDKVWKCDSDGWHQHDRIPTKQLQKIPDIYIVEDEEFDTSTTQEHFNYILEEAGKKDEKETAVLNSIVVKKDIED